MKKMIITANNLQKIIGLIGVILILASSLSQAATIFTINFTNETTTQVVPATYEYSNTPDMSSATAGAGKVIPIVPGTIYYIRVKGTGTTAIQTLGAPARPVTPAYSIDFINETTNQVISSADEYSSAPEMTYLSTGNGAKKSIYPGQTLYFRTKSTTTSFMSLVQILVIPVRPATPSYTIDYDGETTSQVIASTNEYSSNSAMTAKVSGKDEKVTVVPGQTLYFQIKATTTSFKSLIQELAVAKRPVTPAFSIQFYNETTNEVVTPAYEYCTSIDMLDALAGNDTKPGITPGRNLYFRIKATSSSFKSAIFTLVVPARPATPVYSINFEKESTQENVSSEHEFSNTADMQNALSGIDQKIAVTAGKNLYFRKKATSVSFSSDVFSLTVPGRPVTPSYTIDYRNETTREGIAPTDAYSTTLSLAIASLGTGDKIMIVPGQNLYFYTKATVSSFKSFTQTLQIPQRPAVPSYSIDFINETTKQAVLTTDSYSVSIDMADAVSGSGRKLNITPGQVIYFRKDATSTSFKTDIQTLSVPARPAGPVYSIDFIDEKTVENIPVNVEYDLNPGMIHCKPGKGERISVNPDSNLYFRTMGTSTSFKSDVFVLTVPARPSAPVYSIDFVNEKSAQSVQPNDEYAEAPDMVNAKTGNGIAIAVTPGKYLYFRTKATASSFQTGVFTLAVPSRPAKPTISISEISSDPFNWVINTLYPEIKDYEYSTDNHNNWTLCTAIPLPYDNLKSVSTVEVRIAASNETGKERFCSEGLVLENTSPIDGVSLLEISNLSFYPNPVDQLLNIEVKRTSKVDINIKVVDPSGHSILDDKMDSDHKVLDVSSLSKGVYIVVLTFGNNWVTKKIMKN